MRKWIKNCLGEAWRNGVGGYVMALEVIFWTIIALIGLFIIISLVVVAIVGFIIPHWRGILITIGSVAGFFMVPFLLCFWFSLFWSAIGRPVAKGIRRSAEFAYKVTKRWRQSK